GPAGRMAVNALKVLGPAIQEATEPPEDEVPDFSAYEGNYESRPWGGEVAIRQWGDQLAVLDLPGDELKDAIIRLEYDGDHTFTRLTDDNERRETWSFNLGADGHAVSIKRHGSILSRIE
ncbi:MAG: hypothetical protein OEM63_08010, partial [Gammaproteobacteria bacterium]|nr:hypothetical protein [Gammaproteobacteria bacterium]